MGFESKVSQAQQMTELEKSDGSSSITVKWLFFDNKEINRWPQSFSLRPPTLYSEWSQKDESKKSFPKGEMSHTILAIY